MKSSSATAHPPIDINLDFQRDKVHCPACRQPKASLYVGANGKSRCAACLSGRPGKGGSHAR